ncbi:hypothetical protein Tco_1129612 [Tanacetum coccineum]
MHISKDSGVSLVLRIVNNLPLVENADIAYAYRIALVEPTPVVVEADSLAIEVDSIGIFVRDKMSRDVIKVGSTMRIPLLYRDEYSQWSERFINYLEEKTDGEAMINSIQNGDHPLPVVAQVLLAGTAPNAPPTLKDLKF